MELLCETCAQGLLYCYEQQLRAERLALHARRTELRNMRFEEYLRTPEWRSRRNRALLMAGNRCQLCGKSNLRLDAHHNSYQRRGEELLEDLVVLCCNCHQRYHRGLPEVA